MWSTKIIVIVVVVVLGVGASAGYFFGTTNVQINTPAPAPAMSGAKKMNRYEHCMRSQLQFDDVTQKEAEASCLSSKKKCIEEGDCRG
jgi:hypothetical protein